jgi:hypothetical protein
MSKLISDTKAISNLVKALGYNCAPTIKYSVTESYNHGGTRYTKISTLTVRADDLDGAKYFACNNRRHQRTLIQIFEGEKLLSSQNGGGKWMDVK